MSQAQFAADQRAKILDILATGAPGTIAQLAQALHLSPTATGRHLRTLEQSGQVRRLPPPAGQAPLWTLVPQEQTP